MSVFYIDALPPTFYFKKNSIVYPDKKDWS